MFRNSIRTLFQNNELPSNVFDIEVAIQTAIRIIKSNMGMRLGRAICANNIALVRSLLEVGVDPNQIIYSDIRPIHVAIYLGYTDVTEALLEHGAYMFFVEPGSIKAYKLAKIKNRTSIISMLANWGSQTWIYKRMQVFNYLSSDKKKVPGLCSGVSFMAISALLAENFSLFTKRIHMIRSIPVNRLAETIAEAMQKQAAITHKAKEEILQSIDKNIDPNQYNTVLQ